MNSSNLSSILGTILSEPRYHAIYASRIGDRSLFEGDQKLIFEAMNDLVRSGKSISIPSILGKIEHYDEYTDLEGVRLELNDLYSYSDASNFPSYIDEVSSEIGCLELRRHCYSIIDKVTNESGVSFSDVASELSSGFTKIVKNNRNDTTEKSYSDISKSVIKKIKENAQNPEDSSGYAKTGFDEIDDCINKLKPGKLMVVAGRPGMGKTTFALNVVENICNQKLDETALIFSLEMPKDELAIRTFSRFSGISQSNINDLKLTALEAGRLSSAVDRASKMNIIVEDEGETLTSFEMKVTAYASEKKLSVIMIDYLQLFSEDCPNGRRCGNRTEFISNISGLCKRLSKKFSVPIILLSQLNRDLERRPDKRPVPSDLRESGAIEQDADYIIFLYRDEIYYDNSKDKGLAEIILGKNRNGKLITQITKFLGESSEFKQIPKEDISAEIITPPKEGYVAMDEYSMSTGINIDESPM